VAVTEEEVQQQSREEVVQRGLIAIGIHVKSLYDLFLGEPGVEPHVRAVRRMKKVRQVLLTLRTTLG
jgi:hypothetical protein